MSHEKVVFPTILLKFAKLKVFPILLYKILKNYTQGERCNKFRFTASSRQVTWERWVPPFLSFNCECVARQTVLMQLDCSVLLDSS